MKIQNYIKKQLKNLHDNFDYLSFKYAICNNTGFHIIEVTPYDKSMDDIAYMEAESRFLDKFRETYPEEDIYFSEPSELNDMQNLIASFFLLPNKKKECEIIACTFSLDDIDMYGNYNYGLALAA